MCVYLTRLKSTPASEERALGIYEGDWCLEAESSLVPQDVIWAQIPKRDISLLNNENVASI